MIDALIVELNALGGFEDHRAVDLVMTIQSREALDRQQGHARQAEALLHDYRKALKYHQNRLSGWN